MRKKPQFELFEPPIDNPSIQAPPNLDPLVQKLWAMTEREFLAMFEMPSLDGVSEARAEESTNVPKA